MSRILMWLRVSNEAICPAQKRQLIRAERFGVSRHQLRAESHRNRRTGKKPPARDLEALMGFVPNAAGDPLSLNQYRERFTRLSSMGRFQIYNWLYYRYEFWRLGAIARLNALGVFTHANDSGCQAPLRPD